MSARSSRLHALERGVKAPRKSKAKVRALTVMRLESGTSAVHSNQAPPARLPKDIEDQIAVVRGRAVGRPSRGLLQLEERLLQPRAVGSTSPVVQRHDHGAMPVSPARGPVSQARSLSAQMATSEFGGHYNVESFEDASTPPAPTQIPTTPRNEYVGRISAPAVTTVPPPPVAPCTEFPITISPSVAPETPARDRTTLRRALNPDQEAVAANFERDISAMLGIPAPASTPENQQWDDAVRKATNAPAAAPESPANANPQPPPETPKRNEHEVFNQMGLAMNYANSFDLGAMDLSARFDRFDEELALSPKPTMPVSISSSTGLRAPVEALALNDFDLVEDLAEISGAQPCPTEQDTSTTTPTVASPL